MGTGPLAGHGYTRCGTMETATLAEFVGEARAAGWEAPRRGKLSSLRKQMPAFEAACVALGRAEMSKLGDQLAAALTSSPAVSPPQDAPGLTGQETERALNTDLAKRVAGQSPTDSPGAPLGGGADTPPLSHQKPAEEAAAEQKTAEEPASEQVLKVGMVVGALWAPQVKKKKRGRGEWYRARVTKVLPGGGADLVWLDDGTKGTVAAAEIWVLDPAERKAAETGTLGDFYAAQAAAAAEVAAAAEDEAVATAVAQVKSKRGTAKRARAVIARAAHRHGFTRVPRSEYGGTAVVQGTAQSCLADAVYVCLKDMGIEVTRQDCWQIIGDPAEGATVDTAVAFTLGHGVIMDDLGRGYHKNPRRALSQPGMSIALITLEDDAGVKAAHAVAKVGNYVVDNSGDVRHINQGDIKNNEVALVVYKDVYAEWAKVSIDQVFSLEME